MQSLVLQQRSFYAFLAMVLAVHLVFLVVKMKDHVASYEWTPTDVIKLKLLQDNLQHASKRQIVQSEDAASKEKPLDTSFLSDKDRKFERETMAKNIDSFKKAALGNAKVTNKAQRPANVKKKASLKDIRLSDVGIDIGEPFKDIHRAPASESIKGMENGEISAVGLSATNDYVEEMTLGDFTQLNTVEYKYYGFFHRIRQKLEQFWGQSIQEKADTIFRSGRRLPASENLITSLQITLNTKGEIVGVKILGTSGIKELDDAAIESFNKAGPFPNPPKDLLVNGNAVIEWGFVVKS